MPSSHVIDFDLTDMPSEKRHRTAARLVPPRPIAGRSFGWGDFPLVESGHDRDPPTSPPPKKDENIIESFGWGDFPIVTSGFVSTFPFVVEKPTVVDASDVTASTLCTDSEDDEDDSFLPEDDEAVFSSLVSDVSTKTQSTARHVNFDKVYVREYDVVMGVHPLATGGYPLELGWAYQAANSASVDDFESVREKKADGERLRKLSPVERQHRLSEMSGGSLMDVESWERTRLADAAAETTTTDSDDDDVLPKELLRELSSGTKYGLHRTLSVATLTACV